MADTGEYKVIYLEWQSEWAACCGALQHVYRLMEEQGTLDRTLNDGTITCVSEFVGLLLSHKCLTFIVYAPDGFIAACCWFNLFEGRTCRGHFWVNKRSWGRENSVKIISTMLQHILSLNNEAGYLFDTIIGVTPASNSLAWRLITKCGGRVVGTIPNACQHNGGIVEDGVLTVTTRETLEET